MRLSENEQRTRHRGTPSVGKEKQGEAHPRAEFDELFQHARHRRGSHVHLPLEPASQTCHYARKDDGGSDDGVAGSRRRIALPAREDVGERDDERAREHRKGKQGEKGGGEIFARVLSPRAVFGDEPGERGGDARRRKGDEKGVDGENQLIYPHTFRSQDVGEGDAVERAYDLCDDAAQRKHRRAAHQPAAACGGTLLHSPHTASNIPAAKRARCSASRAPFPAKNRQPATSPPQATGT